MKDFRYMAIVAAAALGLAVAGCSGGGDDGLSTSEEQQLQDDKKAAEAEAQALRDQIAELREALGLEPAGDDDPTASIEDLKTQVTNLQKQIKDAADAVANAAAEAERKAMNAMAEKLFKGLMSPALTTDVVQATSSSITGANEAVNTLTGDNALKPTDDTPPTVHGWKVADLAVTLPNNGGVHHARVYHNQEDPKREAFEEVYETELETDGRLSSMVPARVNGDGFKSEAGKKHHAVAEGAAYVSVRGTYQMAPGVYRCASACTSEIPADRKGFTLSTGWYFVPDDGAEVDVADADYLTFGWWTHDTGKAVAVATFTDTVQTGDPNAAVTGAEMPVGGKATYTGGAAGKYAIYSPLADDNHGGVFTAAAKLNATFGEASTKLNGEITNFMLEGEASSEPWKVVLHESTLNPSNIFGQNTVENAQVEAMTTWSIGDYESDKSGTWNASMYNRTAPAAATPTTPASDGVPQNVLGEFRTQFGDGVGHMVGAFGATRKTE